MALLEAKVVVSFLAAFGFLLPTLTSGYLSRSRYGETEAAKLARLYLEDKGTHDEAYIVTVNSSNVVPGDPVVLRNINGTLIANFTSWVEPQVGNTFFYFSDNDNTFCWIAGKNHEISCSHNHTAAEDDSSKIKSTLGRAHAESPFIRIWGDHILSNRPEGRDVFKFQKFVRNTTDIIGLDLRSLGLDPGTPFDIDVQSRLLVFCSLEEKAIKIVSLDPGSVAYESMSYADMDGDCTEVTVESLFHEVYFFQGQFLRNAEYWYPGLKGEIRTLAKIPYRYFRSLSCEYRTCAWVGGLEGHGEFVEETSKASASWLIITDSRTAGKEEPMQNITTVYAAQPGSTILQVQRFEDNVGYQLLDYCSECAGFCFQRSPWSHGSEFHDWMNCYCPTSGRSVGAGADVNKCRVLYSESPPESQFRGAGPGSTACHQGWAVSILVVASVAGVALLAYYVLVVKRRKQRDDDEPLVDQFGWASS